MPTPKRISQEELQSVLEDYNRALEKSCDIRERLLAGAVIENGPHHVFDDGEIAGSQPFQPTRHLSIAGLIFRPAENVQEVTHA